MPPAPHLEKPAARVAPRLPCGAGARAAGALVNKHKLPEFDYRHKWAPGVTRQNTRFHSVDVLEGWYGSIRITPSSFSMSAGIHGSMKQDLGGGKRGMVKGWSPSSTRAHANHLGAYDFSKMESAGNVLTYTFSCRDFLTPLQVKNWWKTLCSLVDYHGVGVYHMKEWQARGAVHLHGISVGLSWGQLRDHWFSWCRKNGVKMSKRYGFRARKIWDPRGLQRYLLAHNVGKQKQAQRQSPGCWPGGVHVWGYYNMRQFMDVRVIRISMGDYARLRRQLARASAAVMRDSWHLISPVDRQVMLGDDVAADNSRQRALRFLGKRAKRSRRIGGARRYSAWGGAPFFRYFDRSLFYKVFNFVNPHIISEATFEKMKLIGISR